MILVNNNCNNQYNNATKVAEQPKYSYQININLSFEKTELTGEYI